MIKEKYRFNKLTPSEFIGETNDPKPIVSIQFPENNVLPLSEYIETDGEGNIIDRWIYDGIRWNLKTPIGITYLYNRYTNNGAISVNIENVTTSWMLKHISLHLSGVGVGGNLIVTINKGAGVVYDILLDVQDMTDIRDYLNVFESEIMFEITDTLDIVWANPSNLTYGLEVAYISV